MCLFRFFPVWLTWIMIWGSLWTHILSLYNQNYGPKLGCGPIRLFFCPNAQSGTKILSAGPKCSVQGSGPKCLLFVLGRPKWILCRLLKSFLHSSLPCTLGQIILILKTPFCFMNVDKIKEEQIVYWPFECHLIRNSRLTGEVESSGACQISPQQHNVAWQKFYFPLFLVYP